MQPSPTSPLHVLVVGSDAACGMALCGRLERAGHRARLVTSPGEAAIWMGSTLPTDVVLWTPPTETRDFGPSIERLRGADPLLPVVVMFQVPDDMLAVAALEASADDCLHMGLSDALIGARLRRKAQRRCLLTDRQLALQRQRGIQDSIADAVITVDEQGLVLDANRTALRLFAAEGAQTLAGQQLAAVIGLNEAQLSTGGRLWLRTVQGGGYWAQASASHWNEAGSGRITWVLRDMTETLRNERMRDEFLASVSHELRTPLTSILGAVGLLAAGMAGRLPASAQPLVAAAQRNGERLGKLIDDVLDLTKLEGDRMTLHCRAQALGPLVGEAVGTAQAYAARLGVQLIQCNPAAMAASTRRADIDADRLLQVLANLISNAVKHSAPGQTVEISLAELEDGQCIRVTDRGRGVPREFRPQLFEKFAQAESTDHRAPGGTGLGLHLARLLVQRMGGRIGYAPGADEVGSTFEVWFPTVSALQPERAKAVP